MIDSDISIINVAAPLNSATVIIPTTGSLELTRAVKSILAQTHQTNCYVVVDGVEYVERTLNILQSVAPTANYSSQIKVCCLPDNVGADNYYGHRIYAAFTHLVNANYVLYLDQDNWFAPTHVETCINLLTQKKLDWCYSLRNIYDKNGQFICEDNCESLGKWPTYQGANHIDTSSYCLKTDVANKIAAAWHGKWGQDRVFFSIAQQYFPLWEGTGEYTLNYTIGGNSNSVTAEFFQQGNKVMQEKYNGEFPWRKI